MTGMDIGGGYDMGTDGQNDTKGSAEKKTYKNKSILPVTIRQIKKAEREAGMVKIDNNTPEMVKIMGTVISKEASSTSIEYIISDGTGQIQCKNWVEKDINTNNDSNIDGSNNSSAVPVQGSFVSLVGALKEYNDNLSIQIFGTITIIEDYNEMTHHLLDVILTHNMNTKGPIPGSDAAKDLEKRNANNIGYNMGMQGMGGMQFGTPAGGQGGQRANMDSTVDDAIQKAIKQTSFREEGTTVDETFDYLVKSNENITRQQVEDKVRQWNEDGLLYSTIDDMHFKSCDE
jgi:replication factor A2